MSGDGRAEARAGTVRRDAGRRHGDPLRVADQALRLGGTDSTSPFTPGEIVGLAGLEGQGQVEFIKAVTGIRRP